MQERDRVRGELLRCISAATEEARMIRECLQPDEAFLRTHLRKYILAKFMLPEGSVETEGIRDLVDASLARMMRAAPELVEELDTARSCAGATSAMVKKALLFQAMERDLQLDLPAREMAAAADIPALARLIRQCKAEKDSGTGQTR